MADQLILRLQKGSALTNEELDNNFIYLDTRITGLQTQVENLNADIVPMLQDDYNTKLATKQGINAKLSSISGLTTNGLMSISGNTVTPRSIIGGDYITITNGDGVADNPVIAVSASVVVQDASQTLTNKTIDGNSNSFSNISLVTAVKDTLPVDKGGTGGTTQTGARASLNVLTKPGGTGIVVKTGTDAAATRSLTVGGVGLSVTNADGVSGDVVIQSSATTQNIPNTPVARDANGDFSAGMITASLTGNVTGNADTVTNGVYTDQQYNNPSWLTGLAGSKVFGIPNSSLQNYTVTINGVAVPLGGSFTFDPGVSTNTPNSVVKRDASGNFAAGTITANLNGNANTATTAGTAAQASKLVTPRTINGVAFDGTSNIVVADGTKLPTAGGIMQGPITLPGNPIQNLHAVPKQYVDGNDHDVHYGTLLLSSAPVIGNSYVDIFPPAGKTMANLKGFLPAMGSSNLAQPIYNTNLILVVDISYSMYRRHFWNGYWHDTIYKAAGKAAQALINHYAQLGPVNVCIVRTYNGYKRNFKWFQSHYDASASLNTVIDWTADNGSVIDAHDNRPNQTVAHTAVHFLTDANRDFGLYDGFGGSLQTWRNFLNYHKIHSHAVCLHEEGLPTHLNQFAWDGRLRSEIRAFRAMLDYDLPRTYFPGVYNTASINYTIMNDRIRVSLTDGVEVNMASVNWMALWGKA